MHPVLAHLQKISYKLAKKPAGHQVQNLSGYLLRSGHHHPVREGGGVPGQLHPEHHGTAILPGNQHDLLGYLRLHQHLRPGAGRLHPGAA